MPDSAMRAILETMKKRSIDLKKIKNTAFSFLICLTVCISSLFGGCHRADNTPCTKTGLYFDTVISITLYGDDKIPYIDHCFELAALYESYFSPTLPDSDITNINTHVGEPVTVHEETAELIQKGMEYYHSSEGKFDITVGALSSLWHFPGTGESSTGENISSPKVPSKESIDLALSTVDASKIFIDGNTVMLTADGSSIDLGGIAKGYIADRMKEYLISQGVTSGIINLGGNVLVLGPKNNQKKGSKSYTIGIQDPFSEDGETIASVNITDESIVTSGIYQRCFEQDGVLYHHILDIDTGYPCQNDLASVTIINHSSVDGDALSTVCFMMGQKDGLAYAEALKDTEAIFITTDGQISYTSGLGTEIPFQIL